MQLLLKLFNNADLWASNSTQVVCMNFFDIVLDFILMDAFEDLENPPTSVVAVLRNRWLSDSFKETVISSLQTVYSCLPLRSHNLTCLPQLFSFLPLCSTCLFVKHEEVPAIVVVYSTLAPDITGEKTCDSVWSDSVEITLVSLI